MMEVTARLGRAYRPPNNEELRTRLLVKAVQQLDSELLKKESSVRHLGSTITCDGWTDPRMRPILNILQVFAVGAKFLDSVDTSGDTKVCA